MSGCSRPLGTGPSPSWMARVAPSSPRRSAGAPVSSCTWPSGPAWCGSSASAPSACPVVVDEVLSHQALQLVVRALVRGRRGEAEALRDGTGTATREWREIMETLGLGE